MSETILITGATAGLGRHAALHLAREGHRVIATGRKVEALAALEQEAKGLALDTLVLDVTDEASRNAAFLEVERLTNGAGIDVLVNNAGYGQVGPVDSVPDERVREQFETNVFGLLAVTRLFVPQMQRRGSGKIVLVSSMTGRVVTPFMGVYSATKFAVEALGDAMRVELAPFGIRVVLLEPGYIRTRFADTSIATLNHGVKDSIYAPALKQVDLVMARFDAMGSDPIVVSRALSRIVRARRPRARYVAPFFAGFLEVANLLPSWIVDRILIRVLGVNGVMREIAAAARAPSARAAA